MAIISGDSLITLTNSGTGNSILNSTSNPSFTTKGIVAGTNITISDSGTDLTINSGGGSYTFQNGGTGTSLVASTSTITDFKPVSVTAGSNVTISGAGTDNLTISSAGALGTNTVNITSITASASTYYPVFNSAVSGVTSTLSTDSGGLTYKPSDNTLTAGLINSVLFTSSNLEPTVGFMGLATSATKIQTTGIPTSASTYYPTFVPTSTSANSEVLSKDVGLKYTPTPNTLATDNFNGVTFTSSSALPTIGFVGASTSASTIQTTGIPLSASFYYITFVPTSTSNNNEILSKDAGLTYQPSTDSIGCGIVNAVTFNSSTPVSSPGFVGTCSQALQLATTLQTGSTSLYYPIFAPSGVTSTGQAMSLDAGLTFQPSSNTLTADNFAGNLTGTATLSTNVVAAGTNNLLVQTGTNTTGILSNGTSGQFLKSNGVSLPTWVDNSTVGLQMSFGGLGSMNGYLAPNRWADPSAITLTSGVATKWRVPFNGSLTAISSSVTTISGSTTLVILKNGTVALTISSVAVSLTNYVATTSTSFTTGDYIEIFTGVASCGACLFTLYFG